MESEARDQQGRRERFADLGRAAVPYWFAVCGLALGVGAILKDEPVAGACGAVAGVTAGCLQQWRARFHRDHVDALRERLRTQRLESEQMAAQLRQTVSSLQTELWQHRMVALATPAFGIQMSALAASAAPAASTAPAALGAALGAAKGTSVVPDPAGPGGGESLAQAS